MILGKYKSKRKLGKGAYGQVLLVEDNKGNQYALKLISMRALQKQSYLLDYLEGQIDCMKSIDSPYIMKLHQTQQDENFKYLLCEYCDGGDLLNFQAKQPGKVFTLQKATQIMAEVIKGLFELHDAGYLHRDIKSQNILVKNEKDGKQSFKLADFGFSKKSSDVGGTVLGTQNYMSPQIFKNDIYGYEVDMWAFGVLFYFMLNMEFPFKVNPHAPLQKKQAQLQKMAAEFDYEKYIKTSKKKLTQNCSKQLNDLFKQMFNPVAQNRITFAKIRQHPVFKKYFPETDMASKILYGKKFESKIIKKDTNVIKKQPKNQQQDNVRQTYSVARKQDENFPKERFILQNKKDQIDFLKQNALQFYENNQYFRPQQRYSLAFNLLKYYIILLREYIHDLTPQILKKQYPGLNWKGFCQTKQFKEIKRFAQEDRLQNEIKFQQIYDQCSYYLGEISAINPKFKPAYDKDINEKDFQGAFKQSYRKSTHTSFNTLRGLMKTHSRGGNKLNYNLSTLVISHVFNHIFFDKEKMKEIFIDYFNEKKKNPDTIDYAELREWMTKATAGQLNNLARQIIKKYFT